MRYAAVYGRYSCERQNEQSIEGQLRICQQYADQHDLKIVETYIDRATSGTNDNRPAFQKMLTDCEKTVLWDIVLVYAIDRFGRNSIEIAVNKQKLKKNNKTLISATQRTSENIDGTKNLDGILLENMYIGLAEYYSAELSQKILRGLHENRLKGFFTGGRVPYGYKKIDKKLYPDEQTADVVRFIFQKYAAGTIVKDIVDMLQQQGITYNGKPFALNTIYEILRREKYIGLYHHNGEVYTNIYPKIVSTSLFNQVQAILEDNKLGSISRDVNFLLRGKLKCGICGKSMNGESGTSCMGPINYYYKCATRKKKKTACPKESIKKDKIEKLVIDNTIKMLSNQIDIALISEAIYELHEKRINEHSILNILKADKEKAQKSLANVMNAIEEGLLTATTKNRLTELENEIENLNCKILAEECKEKNQLKKEDIILFLTEAIKKTPKLLIDTLIQKIILHDDKIEIFYNYTNQKNPDEPLSDVRRDFYLQFKIHAAVTVKYLVVEFKLPKKARLHFLKQNGRTRRQEKDNGSSRSELVEINGLEPSTS